MKRIYIPIYRDGVIVSSVTIDFLHMENKTQTRYFYEWYVPGKGKTASHGEIVVDNIKPITDLIRSVFNLIPKGGFC